MPILSASLLALGAVTAGAADTATPSGLAELLRQHTHPVAVESNVLVGPGADWLARETETAQFVLVGEDHNVAQIPPFVTALFTLLQERNGFQYLATEQPGLTLEQLSTEPLRGQRAAIGELARRHPFGFSFIGDEELAMLADIGARSRAKSNPLWGLEQATGVVPYAEVLAEIAPDAARPAAQALLKRARAREVSPRDYRNGTFLQDDPSLPEDLAALRKAFAPYPGSRADRLLRALERSREIYDYNARARARETEANFYNNAAREEWFREQFLGQYRLAAAAEQSLPRVLLKFGSAHMMRGLNLFGMYALGTFLADFALANGQRTLSIDIVAYATGADFAKGPEAFRWFAPFADRPDCALIDLRPLRPRLAAGHFKDTLADDAWRVLFDKAFAYDVVLLIPGATPRHTLLTGAKQ